MRRRKRSHKGPVNSKKVTQDGIAFSSSLEKYMYLALKKEKLFEQYEGEKFQLIEGFQPQQEYWERQSNSKGDFTRRDSKKVLAISYTPDFTGRDYIIETKGRANETFPIRWKLFKLWCLKNNETRALYKPQNQKECDLVVQLIKQNRDGQK